MGTRRRQPQPTPPQMAALPTPLMQRLLTDKKLPSRQPARHIPFREAGHFSRASRERAETRGMLMMKMTATTIAAAARCF